MRKITLFICGLILSFGLQAQEIVTRSKYDVNGDNQTSIADVTEVVNKVLSKSGPEPEVVTAENLNNVLKQINEKTEFHRIKIVCYRRKNRIKWSRQWIQQQTRVC